MLLKIRQTAATTKLLCDAREDAELDEVNACLHTVKNGRTSVSSEHKVPHDTADDCSTLLNRTFGKRRRSGQQRVMCLTQSWTACVHPSGETCHRSHVSHSSTLCRISRACHRFLADDGTTW